MDKPKLILFYELCRLCLEKPGANDMYEIIDLDLDIFLCTGIKVSSSDNLPRKICLKCLEVVINAKRLRVMAKANDMHLKNIFNDDNEKDQQSDELELTHYEECFFRNSTKYSNSTTNLKDTIEKESPEKSRPNRRQSSGSCDHSKSEVKIAVRKDLFESSSAVTTIKNDDTTTEQNSTKVNFKRGNSENEDSVSTYDCEVCQKKFSTPKKFYLHQRAHNKNIVCPLDVCGKKFAIKGDLEKHIRSHTGERPYSCEICKKKFGQRGTLTAHRKTVHAKENQL